MSVYEEYEKRIERPSNKWRTMTLISFGIIIMIGAMWMGDTAAKANQDYELRINESFVDGFAKGLEVGVVETFNQGYINGVVTIAINNTEYSLLSPNRCGNECLKVIQEANQ